MLRIDKLVPLNRQIVKDIQEELRLQGHYDTGNLERSMDPRETYEGGTLVLEAYAAGYIEELENGLKPSEIVISESERQDLIEWVRRKISGGSFLPPETIAGLIIQKWKREGKPLEGSKQYSKNGKILGAIKDSFENNEQEYFKRMDEAIEVELDYNLFKNAIETI